MNDIIIKASQLSKRYKDLVAVNSIDFEIKQGETFGFLGPNGAGKTTTMKMIYCFILPDSGVLEVDGMDVVKYPRQVKNILGIVHQEDSLDPDLNVKENLITYARYFDIPARVSGPRADELIAMMSLTEKQDTIIEELSGGMRRRLMLIRGLINSPKILVLDEPTTGLDPQARHLVWQKLKTLKKSGITIILTTHYMDEAAQLCDRLLMMHQGKIIAEGNPASMVDSHIGKEVIELVEPDESLITALPDIINNDGYFERAGEDINIYTNEAETILSGLSRFNPKGLVKRPANLEDVFLKLSGRALLD
ncbi:MAG: ATP-binding cassette domain-containing protein [candidate division Zixibacteria bacterium]|nr:ATP-binding cassette domain-containing protein [candidate division Zixibacteria bacterium]